MDAFIDFTYYTDEYHGASVSSSDFPRLALEATALVEMATFNRAGSVIGLGEDTDVISKIKLATCAVMDAQYKIAQSGGSSGVIASESVGSHSVNYVSRKGADASVQDELVGTIYRYLANTGLMYRGMP